MRAQCPLKTQTLLREHMNTAPCVGIALLCVCALCPPYVRMARRRARAAAPRGCAPRAACEESRARSANQQTAQFKNAYTDFTCIQNLQSNENGHMQYYYCTVVLPVRYNCTVVLLKDSSLPRQFQKAYPRMQLHEFAGGLRLRAWKEYGNASCRSGLR